VGGELGCQMEKCNLHQHKKKLKENKKKVKDRKLKRWIEGEKKESKGERIY
jgi:hypothetical protein